MGDAGADLGCAGRGAEPRTNGARAGAKTVRAERREV